MNAHHFKKSILFSILLLGLSQVSFAACDQTLSPGANVASAASSATAGSTICLNAGSYSSVSFTNINRSGYVTIQSTSGRTASVKVNISGTTRFIRLQSLTINGLDFGGGGSSCPTNIQVLNSAFGTTQAVFRTDTCGANNNILIDGNTFGAFNASGGLEGRLSFCCGGVNPSGITVSNNTFGPGGCSDGVQTAAVGIVIGPGNVFQGIVQSNCAAHVDSIQGYGQSHTVITGNYFVDNTIDIGFYDGGASETITNNVFGPPRGQLQNLQLGGIQGMTFTHNTFRDTTIAHGTKFANTPNSSWLVRDNIFVNSDLINSGDQGQCNNCTYTSNMFDTNSLTRGTNNLIGSPTFVGGSSPSTFEGYKLTPDSRGYRAASDGSDMGAFISPTSPTLSAPTNLRITN